jgi:CHASE2 domain-containing sensor protein
MARIFISYRRDDTGKTVWRLFDWLERQFGAADVFFDREVIGPGDKFPQILEHRLAESEVLIAVIGPRWLTIADDQGRPRLWAERDYVAYEVSSALSRTTRIIPVLVDSARMPAREELPPALSALADNQALSLDDAHFRTDFEKLVDAIKGRPRGYIEREGDRALRLARYVKRTSIMVPLIVLVVFFAAWVRLFSLWGMDTQIASYSLWMGKGLMPVASEDRVVVAALDEETERTLARPYDASPFWRGQHARLIDRLSDEGVRSIVFDFYFERETESDAVLAQAATRARERGTRVVFGVRGLDADSPRLAPALLKAGVEWGILCIGHKRGYLFTAPLARARQRDDQPQARVEDCDEGADNPALAMVAVFDGKPADVCSAARQITLVSPNSRVDHIPFSEMERLRSTPARCAAFEREDRVATRLLVLSPPEFWRREPHRYSYAHLLGPDSAPESLELKGKTVIVGVTTVTSTAARDIHIIERGLWREERFGVELQADALRNLLSGFTVRPLQPLVQFVIMLITAVLGAVVSFLTADKSRRLTLAVLAGVVMVYFGISLLLLSRTGILLNLMYDIVAFVLAYRILGWIEKRAEAGITLEKPT